MKKTKNDEQYIKNPSEPDEKADELNENGPTSEKRTVLLSKLEV